MKLKVGDIVLIIGSQSIPSVFLGSYGRITAVSADKVNVQIKERVNEIGSLSHTTYTNDLEKIGEINI